MLLFLGVSEALFTHAGERRVNSTGICREWRTGMKDDIQQLLLKSILSKISSSASHKTEENSGSVKHEIRVLKMHYFDRRFNGSNI